MLLPRFASRSRAVIALAILAVLLTAALIVLLITKQGTDDTTPAHHKSKPSQEHQKPQRPTPESFTFPQGGTTLLPKYRFVALYGTPTSTRMGVLGEQPLTQSITRAKQLAASYKGTTGEHIYPTFEIIASVASANATADNDYSNELSPQSLKPWVDAAKKAGIYVVLDLQPGREHFLSQAKQYESLLREPHVGLALDPEWRLSPTQVHLEQIGRVSAAEVNEVGDWLNALTTKHKLPQKLFLLHQFRLSMITHREQLHTYKNLATVIQMDGNGAQPTKADTWRTLLQNAPNDIYFGWKNFYDEDHPMLNPTQTMALTPKPWYVSYQ